ncbi:putative IMP dehydrogenase/GMP reductase, partial [Trifolium medium]|nr:putative IMP dehydrogenase/GMP reductase [Trifolium medium]
MPAGEITVTLDDVSCLLHLPLTSRLLDHTSLTKEEGVVVLVDLLGAEPSDAEFE